MFLKVPSFLTFFWLHFLNPLMIVVQEIRWRFFHYCALMKFGKSLFDFFDDLRKKKCVGL